MNLALGSILAIAVVKGIQKSQKSRDVRYPGEAVYRPAITSAYPLRYIVINDGIGGVSEGVKQVFSNAKFLGYTPDQMRGLASHMDRQRQLRPTYPDPIENFNQTLSTQFIYYRLNLKQSLVNPMFSPSSIEPWKSSRNLQRFIKIISTAKAKDFVIELDKFKAFKMDKDLNDFIEMLVNASKGRLNKSDLVVTILDSCIFTGQTNEKIYLTSFPLAFPPYVRIESFVTNLDPVEDELRGHVPSPKHLSFMLGGRLPAYTKGSHSDTGKFQGALHYPERCTKKMPSNPLSEPYLLVDRRTGEPVIRSFTLVQLERLAGFPTNYLKIRRGQTPGKLLSKSSNPLVVKYLCENLALSRSLFQAKLEDR